MVVVPLLAEHQREQSKIQTMGRPSRHRSAQLLVQTLGADGTHETMAEKSDRPVDFHGGKQT